MPMECPQCGLQQSFRKYWTEAQRKHGSPSVGGRNYCKECYNQGPRPEDWREVSNCLSQITQLSTTHQHNKYEWKHFMVEFLRRMDARTRKDWSYKGLLPIRCPTDYITKIPGVQNLTHATIATPSSSCVKFRACLKRWGGQKVQARCYAETASNH